MLPFHKIYSWLFKSFSIHSEISLIDRITDMGYRHIMLIKRSWIFILFVLWMPLLVFLMGMMSVWFAASSIELASIKFTIIIGNILMGWILIFSSFFYIRYFRRIHGTPTIYTDMEKVKNQVNQWDIYFINFFNWSLTNQLVLTILFFLELSLVFAFRQDLTEHFWLLILDSVVIVIEFVLLGRYRKKMIDLEMDYNIVIPWKIFFINQTGVLSDTQTLDSDKIKTVRAQFPGKIASFFNYGNIDILTEGDTAMMGVMKMNFITDPNNVVSKIQKLLVMREENLLKKQWKAVSSQLSQQKKPRVKGEKFSRVSHSQRNGSSRHALDTREKIRDVLR